MQSSQDNLPKKQESKAEKKPSFKIPFDRIIYFVDGIFAFAMTILVINIAIPTKQQHMDALQVNDFIINNGMYVLNYLLSFLLIAYFWIIYNKLTLNIEKTSLRFVWLNIFLCMFVVLIPFTTNLISYYNFDTWADFIFNLNVLIISLFSYAIYYFTQRDYPEYRYNIHPLERKSLEHTLRLTIIVAVIAGCLSFIIPTYSLLVYLLYIPIVIITKKKLKKKHLSELPTQNHQ